MVFWPGEEREKTTGMYRQHLKKGECFENFSAGGSGWGAPEKRDPAAVEYDLRNGYVTKD
jgi:N-methylhydantoinase B/oxoprolinase/acetone carboxylase alpha subunit